MKGNFGKRVKQAIALLLLMILSASSKYFISVATEENLPQEEVIAKAQIETNIEKYVNYDVDGKKGVLVQLGLETGIEYEKQENYLQISASGIQMYAPQIEGKYPNSVELIDKTINNINEPKTRYNQETGEFDVIIINTKELGIEKTQENKMAENYSVVLNYGSECYNGENKERELQYKAKAIKLLANEDKTRITEEKEQTQNVKENIGNIIDIRTTTEEIYNGYTKANKIYGTDYSTNYAETVEIEIAKAQLGEKTTIDFESVLENQTKPEIIYEKSEINKAQVLDILGEDGNLKILDEEGNTLGEINKETQANEEGICKINYEKEISKIQVVTTTPQKVGKIEIQNNKKIKAEVTTEELKLVKETSQIKVEKTVKEIQVVTVNNEQNEQEIEKQVEIYNHNQENQTEVKDSTTAVRFTPSSVEWTNERQNEVELEVELRNNKSKYNLFKNPSIEIKLPEESSKVILNEPTLINADGLQIAGIQYIEETKTIRMDLYGEQQKYLPSNIEEGTKIKISAIIILNAEIEDKDVELKINLKNENAFSGETEQEEISKTVKLHNFSNTIQSEEQNEITRGMVINSEQPAVGAAETEQQIQKGPIQLTIKPIRGDTVLNNGDTVYEGEFIKYEITATNTTDEDIENAKIVATIPNDLVFANLEPSTSNEESYYTYEEQIKNSEYGKLSQSVKTKEIDIEKIEANASVTKYFEVKVKKLNDFIEKNEIQDISGTRDEIERSISLKENLLFDSDNGFLREELSEDERNQLIVEAELLREIKEELVDREEQEISIPIKIFVEDNLSDQYTINNNIKTSDISVELQRRLFMSGIYEYGVKVEGNIEEEKTIKMSIPECFEIYNTNVQYSLENNNIIINVKDNRKIYIDLIQVREPKNEFVTTAVTLNDKYKSNQNSLQLEYNAVDVNIRSDNEAEKVNYGDKIIYNISVSNTSRMNDTNNNFGDLHPIVQANISEDLIIEKIEYNDFSRNEETGEITETIQEKSSGVLNEDFYIPYGQTLRITMTATPKPLQNQKNVECSITASENGITIGSDSNSSISGVSFQPKTSRTITHTILPIEEETQEKPDNPDEPEEPSNPDNPEDPQNPDKPTEEPTEETKKYKISGIVWNDENEDGTKQENEKTLNSIEVYLLDEKGNLLKKTVSTEGSYIFSELNKGSYYVAGKYDENKYHITKYIAKGDNTSKVTAQKIKIENNEITAGSTELLTIEKDTTYINIGLVENKKFDFKVENYITKVTVQTANNTETTEYNNLTLAKKEIKAKEIEGARLTVEYKIKVTNNGEIAGTVGKVVDKLPQGFGIITGQAGNWIQNKQGEIISTSLENKEIKPGESQELTLIATIVLTENTTGTFTNTVTIENINNEQKIEETSTQNNTAKSEIIISISTGVLTYIIVTGIITGIICLFATKFRKLRKITLYMFSLFMIFSSVFVVGNSNVKADYKIAISGGNYWYNWNGTNKEKIELALTKDIYRAYRWVNPSYEGVIESEGRVFNNNEYTYLLQIGDDRYLVYNCPTDSPERFNKTLYDGKFIESGKLNSSHQGCPGHYDYSTKLYPCGQSTHYDEDYENYWRFTCSEKGGSGGQLKKITTDEEWNELKRWYGELNNEAQIINSYNYKQDEEVSIEPSESSIMVKEGFVEKFSAVKYPNWYPFSFLYIGSFNDLRVFKPRGHVGDGNSIYNYYCINQGYDAWPGSEVGLELDPSVRGSEEWSNAYVRYSYENFIQGINGHHSNWSSYKFAWFSLIYQNGSPFIEDKYGDYGVPIGSSTYPYEEEKGILSIYEGTLNKKGNAIVNLGKAPYYTYMTSKHNDVILPKTKQIGGSNTSTSKIVDLSQDKASLDYIYIGRDGENLSLKDFGKVELYRTDGITIKEVNYNKCKFTINGTETIVFDIHGNNNNDIEFYNSSNQRINNTTQLFNATSFYIKIKKSKVGKKLMSIVADVSADFCWEYNDGKATGHLHYGASQADGTHVGGYQELIGPKETLIVEGKGELTEKRTKIWDWFEGGFELNKADKFTGKQGDITAGHLDGLKFVIKNSSGYLHCDSNGVFDGYKANENDASKFITKENGETYLLDGNGKETSIKMIIGLPTSKQGSIQYNIVELDEVPDYLKDYYGNSRTRNKTVNLNSGELLKTKDTTNVGRITLTNDRTHTNIELQKIGQVTRENGSVNYVNLEGIKFAIHDDTDNKWVSVDKDGVYVEYDGFVNYGIKADSYNGKGKTQGYPNEVTFRNVDGTDKLNGKNKIVSVNGKRLSSVFETNKYGYIYVRRLPIGHTYTAYEIDVGAYDELYKDWYDGLNINGQTIKYYKSISFKTTAEADGLNSIGESDYTKNGEKQVLNIQDNGALQFKKIVSNTKASLQGIKFKIRAKGISANEKENDPSTWKWLNIKYSNDGYGYRWFANGNTEFDNTGTGIRTNTVETNANGQIPAIYKVPIYTDKTRTKKIQYEVYEVYIPENLRDVLTLDSTGYKKLYEINANNYKNCLGTGEGKIKPIVTFELDSYIDTELYNGRYRSRITVPTNMKSEDISSYGKCLENEQAYITISGNVWEEILNGKNTVSAQNNLKDSKDYNIKDLKVELIDASDGNKIVSRAVDYNDTRRFGDECVAYTNDNGNYEFKYVILNDVVVNGTKLQTGLINGNYKIRFVYDGVTYQSVIPYGKEGEDRTPQVNTSKIAEEFYKTSSGKDNRQEFNSKWDKIERDHKIGVVDLKYYSEGSGLTRNVNLVSDQKPGTGNGQIYDVNRNASTQTTTVSGNFAFPITATTDENKLRKYYDNLITEKKQEEKILYSIDNINLGLYYRERPNLTLQKDEHMAHVTVAGKEYTYVYNSKLGQAMLEKDEIISNNDNFNTTYYGLDDNNPSIKFDTNPKRSLPIYEADVNYGIGDNAPGTEAERLKATITYKIKLQNAANNLYSTVNSINEYYTSKISTANGDCGLNLNAIYLSSDGKKTEFNTEKLVEGTDYSMGTADKSAKGYVGTKIIFNKTIQLDPATSRNSTKYLYLEFEIQNPRTYFYEVMGENGIPKSELENYAEIASYSVYYPAYNMDAYNPDNYYPGVDRTSIPGNLDVSNYEQTREDDSDKALGLRVVEAVERSVEGLVFEDAPVTEYKNKDGSVRPIDIPAHNLTDLNGNTYQNADEDPTNVVVGEQNGKIDPGEERIGDGIYNPDETGNKMKQKDGTLYVENGVNGVKVSLLDDKGNYAKVWVKEDTSDHGHWEYASSVETSTINGSDGLYAITGIAPGNYKVEFEWGAKAGGKDVRDYKCTVFTNPLGEIKDGKIEIKGEDKLSWIYAEDTTRYSDAVDDYITRQAVDQKELGLTDNIDEMVNGAAHFYGDLSEVNMISSTANFKIGIEMKTEDEKKDIDHGVFYEAQQNTYYEGRPAQLTTKDPTCLPFHIDAIDFGLIERPKQALGVEKHLTSVKMSTTDGRPVVIAYFNEAGQMNVIAGQKYITGGYDLGYLWAQVDKDIQEAMQVELEYEILVKNYSELDYDYKNYYYIGEIGGNLIKLSAENIYDYLGGSSLSRDDKYWERVETTSGSNSGYLNTDPYLFGNSIKPTETEKEIINNGANRIDNYGDHSKLSISKISEEWSPVIDNKNSLDYNAKLIRSKKLTDKDIVKGVVSSEASKTNPLIKQPYVPGEVNKVKLKASKLLGTGDDILFSNDIEIAKVEYEKDEVTNESVIRTARRPDITLAPLYDRSEWITISPATGGDKDYLGFTMVAIGNLTMLACGIILIKRRLRHK